ncbi:MAG: hypothetical protein HFH14_08950 [Lachnospiraceae bacterium]|nr:hypothetical protein [Lachnospiraceae bacterium]
MTGIDILLIVVGVVLVIASFIISEKISGYGNESANGREIWSERDEVTIKDRIQILLSDKSEQIVSDTDEKLCHLSNEKIMEFQEFSEQINEKLNENHNQSVFLYKMLTEKQGEMKEWISELDSKYAGIKDELNLMEEAVSKIKSIGSRGAVKTNKTANSNFSNTENTANRNKKPSVQQGSVPKEANNDKRKADVKKTDILPDRVETSNPKKAAPNKNDRILEMADSGKSLIEISKQLGIGQGEVKLVLDLYRGNKK